MIYREGRSALEHENAIQQARSKLSILFGGSARHKRPCDDAPHHKSQEKEHSGAILEQMIAGEAENVPFIAWPGYQKSNRATLSDSAIPQHHQRQNPTRSRQRCGLEAELRLSIFISVLHQMHTLPYKSNLIKLQYIELVITLLARLPFDISETVSLGT